MRSALFHSTKNSSFAIFFPPLILAFFLVAGCNKKENFNIVPVSDFIVLQKGKFITYRVDSLVFTQFGRQEERRSYQIKHVVDSAFVDAEGRLTYRIFKYITDSLALSPWKTNGTYTITILSNQVEWNENNLVQIKLHNPVRKGFTWKGNLYLTSNPLDPPYNFSNDDDMANWGYSYQENPTNFQFKNRLYKDVITVKQIDTRFNVPITIPTAYAFKNYAADRFAKGIGLVQREWECWEYQPNTGGSGGPYKVGFGITQWMIDHN